MNERLFILLLLQKLFNLLLLGFVDFDHLQDVKLVILNIWNVHFIVDERFKFPIKVLLLKNVTFNIPKILCLPVPQLSFVVS